jgi:hypothetical protein
MGSTIYRLWRNFSSLLIYISPNLFNLKGITMEEYKFKEERIDRVFDTAEGANDYYDFLIKSGYSTEEITVIMSKDTKKRFYATNEHISNTGDEALKGAGAGSAIGGTLGAVVGAFLAIGSSLVIPGLGIAVAGPVAAALAGAGTGGASGAIVGAFLKAGLSDSAATEYKNAMDKGQIIISVAPKDRHDVVLTSSYGKEIHNGVEED